jgi:predicted HTH transcriptional regulator
MPDEDILNRLDTIISLLKLAHRERLAEVREELAADDVSAAILEATAGDQPVSAGSLKNKVMKATGESESTVKRRIAGLVAMDALSKQGGGPTTAYKSTGLI